MIWRWIIMLNKYYPNENGIEGFVWFSFDRNLMLLVLIWTTSTKSLSMKHFENHNLSLFKTSHQNAKRICVVFSGKQKPKQFRRQNEWIITCWLNETLPGILAKNTGRNLAAGNGKASGFGRVSFHLPISQMVVQRMCRNNEKRLRTKLLKRNGLKTHAQYMAHIERQQWERKQCVLWKWKINYNNM